MKTLAEQMREAIDSINSGKMPEEKPHVYASGYKSKSAAESIRAIMDDVAAETKPKTPGFDQLVSEGINTSDTTIKIGNWRPEPEDENAPWEEYVQLRVEYTVSGKYYPATRDEPEEHPELEIYAVYIEETNEEVTQELDSSTMASVEEKVWAELDSDSDSSFNEPDPDPYWD